jgi:hypothetical protein
VPGEGCVWTSVHERLSQWKETELTDTIIRLRAIHWNVDKYPLNHLVTYFASEPRGRASEIYPIAYSNLRLDFLPKFELSNVNESGIAYHYYNPNTLL